MANPELVFLSVFLLILFSALIYKLSKAINVGKAIIAILLNEPIPPHFEFNVKTLSPFLEKYLLHHFPYYSKLNRKQKKVFGSRLMKFIDDKNFESRQNLRITNEMKLLISAAAIKITFGLRNYMYDNFHTIIIYPDEFNSPTTRAKSKGETNSSGVIVFSWKDVKFGYDYPSDSLNLAYHEFAHALFIEHFINRTDDHFSQYYSHWLRLVRDGSKLAEVKRKHIFRDYAAVNEQEFYAIAVENFFERSEAFKSQLPKLYHLMTLMLNQDPITGRIA